jgi:hypothetical protein
MDIAIFFLPVALVVAQYFTSGHTKNAPISRDSVGRESYDVCCA